MHATILWTINYFPIYANLLGWSTKGQFFYPIYNKDNCSYRLQNGQKWCYMDHHRFLPINHRFRHDKRSFDGNEEHRKAPKELSREDVLHQLDGMKHITLGKRSKNKILAKRKIKHAKLEHNWKKKFPIAILENPYFAS